MRYGAQTMLQGSFAKLRNAKAAREDGVWSFGVRSRPSSDPDNCGTSVRETSDFTGVLREAGWVLGCIVVAIAFSQLASEDKFNQTPFFAVCFYLLTSAVRLGVWAWRRR